MCSLNVHNHGHTVKKGEHAKLISLLGILPKWIDLILHILTSFVSNQSLMNLRILKVGLAWKCSMNVTWFLVGFQFKNQLF